MENGKGRNMCQIAHLALTKNGPSRPPGKKTYHAYSETDQRVASFTKENPYTVYKPLLFTGLFNCMLNGKKKVLVRVKKKKYF